MLSSFVRNPLSRVVRLIRQYSLLVLFVGINAAISWYVPRRHSPPLKRPTTIGDHQCIPPHPTPHPSHPSIPVTLEEILATKNYTTVNVLEEPRRTPKLEERDAFIYLRARCPKLVDVQGTRNHFQICDVSQLREGYFHGTAVSSH